MEQKNTGDALQSIITQLVGMVVNLGTAAADGFRRILTMGEYYSLNFGNLLAWGFLAWFVSKMLKVKVSADIKKESR